MERIGTRYQPGADMEVVMNEKRFWEIVESFHWEDADFDHDARRVELLHTMSFDELAELEKKFADRMKELAATEKRLGYEISDVSDDGWSDLRAHVIGLGRDEYERTLADFDRIQIRATKWDYRESFAYCIPSPRDTANLSIDTHERRAYGYVEKLHSEMLSNLLRLDPETVSARNAAVRDIIDNLRKINGWASDRELREAVAYLKAVPETTWEQGWNPIGWGAVNLANDVEKYILS